VLADLDPDPVRGLVGDQRDLLASVERHAHRQ
jgi:hypothetical protein